MTKYEITFLIDNTSKIIIPLEDPVEFLGPIYIEKILLFFNKQKIMLSNTTIYHDMLYLVNLLKKALNQELLLHSSITEDIGYLYNEHFCNNVTLYEDILPSGQIDWVGYLYNLWESTTACDSWIYNIADGSIIFEATPHYPYMFCEPEEEPHYIPYEEWIKTYKPYFITTLSKETAQEWIQQAQQIIRMVEYNEKRMQYRSKIDVES